MRNSKGITLIALIITIIVMLILVGVTVNVAMQGGLFGTAREASSETIRQAEKDQLISAVLGGLQTGGTFDITKATLPAGAKWITSKTDDTPASPTLGSGNWVMTDSGNKFYVDKDGNVLDDKPAELEKAELLSAVEEAKIDGVFNIEQVELPTGAKWITSKTDDTPASPTLGSGNWVMTDSGNKFYVDKDGNVLDDEPEESISFTLEMTLSNVTLNNSITKKNYSQFSYTYYDKKEGNIEKQNVQFYNSNGDELEFGVDYGFDDSGNNIYYIYLNHNADNYMYVLDPIPNYEGTSISKTGWYKELEPDSEGHAVVQKLAQSNFPIIDGYTISSDNLSADALAQINFYFKDLFVQAN